MKSNVIKKVILILGIVLFNLTVNAEEPEDGTIIIFQTEQTVNFQVSEVENSEIKKEPPQFEAALGIK